MCSLKFPQQKVSSSFPCFRCPIRSLSFFLKQFFHPLFRWIRRYRGNSLTLHQRRPVRVAFGEPRPTLCMIINRSGARFFVCASRIKSVRVLCHAIKTRRSKDRQENLKPASIFSSDAPPPKPTAHNFIHTPLKIHQTRYRFCCCCCCYYFYVFDSSVYCTYNTVNFVPPKITCLPVVVLRQCQPAKLRTASICR